MNDKGICPYCLKEFDVTKYGFKMRCPECGKNIDIFPDDEIFVTLPFGTIGIRGLKEMWEHGNVSTG